MDSLQAAGGLCPDLKEKYALCWCPLEPLSRKTRPGERLSLGFLGRRGLGKHLWRYRGQPLRCLIMIRTGVECGYLQK